MRATITVLLLLAGCAAPAEVATGGTPGTPAAAAATAAASVDALPAALAGFRRVGPVTDYERLPGGAGLGASARYVPANGQRMTATVYIYDRGAARRPEGADNPDVIPELRNAATEIEQMVPLGRYRSARVEGLMQAGHAPGPDGRCVVLRVVQDDGAPTGDGVCVTVQQGSFVKVRVTTWEPPKPDAAGITAVLILGGVEAARAGRAPAPGDRL